MPAHPHRYGEHIGCFAAGANRHLTQSDVGGDKGSQPRSFPAEALAAIGQLANAAAAIQILQAGYLSQANSPRYNLTGSLGVAVERSVNRASLQGSVGWNAGARYGVFNPWPPQD